MSGAVRERLRARGLAPKKSFGQNFLVAEPVVEAIAAACVPDEEAGRAWVVELGAGTGVLTSALVARARHVTAVERDRDLVPLLEEDLAESIASGRLTIAEGDAQTFDLLAALAPAGGDPRVLCGNLPYQITGRLLERAIHVAPLITRAVFMVQEEVADRLAARPATKDYGALTVFARAAFDVRKVRKVSPACFHPPPDVTSAVVELLPAGRAEETPAFRAVVRAAFATRRKTLRNAWRGLGAPEGAVGAAAEAAGVSLDARGETLDVDAFARFADQLTLRGWRPAP